MECAAQEVVITDGITVIEERAFSGCIGLKQVILPNTLKEIGSRAFAGCAALAAVILPIGVVQIGRGVFSETGLKNALLPLTMLWIGEEVYQ